MRYIRKENVKKDTNTPAINLKQKTIPACNTIGCEELENIYRNIITRAQLNIGIKGGRFEIIFIRFKTALVFLHYI